MTIKEISEQLGVSQDTLRYYEKVGMIPPVTRTKGGIRDYQEDDIAWVKLATCMRNAGLHVKVMIDYLNLYKQGDSTIQVRCDLLKEQREKLLEQRKQIEETLERLNYKIARYEVAVETGKLTWDKE
ncbi:MerR family transcriptional regulator [Fusobacterium necrophorum]|uniref:MerR family transcriptional regulator n=1 Tax=Fusobacterium necrophorum TaxID=859 RepID=UPI00254E91CC|nr:MerR family transcriptional regulator [Fusobacterium necrophorum]MDK4516760.1 MerR family transcriptional regulator [Fusobacterium necrophorum]